MLNESNQQNETTNSGCGSPEKSLTFKEWKSLKDSQNKNNEKSAVRRKHVPANSGIMNELNYNNSGNNNRPAGFFPFYNFNRLNISRCNMGGNNYEPPMNNFCGYNNSKNIFDRPKNFFNCDPVYPQGDMMCKPVLNPFRNGDRNDFSIDPKDFAKTNELQNSFRNYDHGYNKSGREPTFDQSKNFFASDCVYPQRDMIRKPVSNPFRGDDRTDYNMYNKSKNSVVFKKSTYSNKLENKHDHGYKNSNRSANFDLQKDTMDKPISNCFRDSGRDAEATSSTNTKKSWKEPEVYITNPKAKSDGKKYIPKPKIPEKEPTVTHEERKQQWKEYRQAMKPFKNRDFYNAKRVVQRLGKKSASELNEKQLIRLTNAQEYMAEHKARLNAKYANYVKAEDDCNDCGEVYLLKTVPRNESNTFTKSSIQKNPANCSKSQHNNHFVSTRVTAPTKKEFIFGGMLEGSS